MVEDSGDDVGVVDAGNDVQGHTNVTGGRMPGVTDLDRTAAMPAVPVASGVWVIILRALPGFAFGYAGATFALCANVRGYWLTQSKAQLKTMVIPSGFTITSDTLGAVIRASYLAGPDLSCDCDRHICTL